ncbi:TolC family protein [Rhizobium skierniewicense]|uniref:TolC family protein n=1 Tax=Rhizobium TaxID=379 RepID=UPI001FADF44B|nr:MULTISPECIES: TolC family protein [Rhizobium]MCI9868158.1 TolC family protein [Rhizobium skierniewicense]
MRHLGLTLAPVLLLALMLMTGCSQTASQASCPAPDRTCASAVPAQNRDRANLGPLSQSAGQTAEVRASLARQGAASSEIDSARAMSRPTVSLEANYKLTPLQNGTRNLSGNEQSTALVMDIPIYQGGRDTAALALAYSNYRASSATTATTFLSVSVAILSSDLELRRQDRTKAILTQHGKALAQLRRAVASEQTEGSATRVDITDVDRQLLQIELNQRQSSLQRLEAERTLARLRAPASIEASMMLAKLESRFPKAVAELQSLAAANNPRIAARQAEIEAAYARLSQADAAYKPRLGLRISAGLDRENYGQSDNSTDASATLNFSMPLYTGGAREASLRSREKEIEAATFDKHAILQDVGTTLAASMQRLETARAILALAQKQENGARMRSVGVKTERELGERSVFDEIRAISDIADAQLAVNNARYEADMARLTIAAECGLLSDGSISPAVQISGL